MLDKLSYKKETNTELMPHDLKEKFSIFPFAEKVKCMGCNTKRSYYDFANAEFKEFVHFRFIY